MKTLGIDIGTTTISEVVLDTDSKHVIKAVTISNGSFLKTKNEWEKIQDPEKLVEKARQTADELLAQYPDIAAIGLTGQMHGIVYLDKTGASCSPLYIWQDGRGNLPEFDGKSLVEIVTEETGLTVATGYGLITHLYNLKKDLVPANARSLCTISDYLGMVLTGRTTPLLHSSNGASLGFYDVKNGTFHTEKLEKYGVSADFLPEVTDEVEILGTYQGRPVTTALGDNQASFFGSVGMEDSTILLNMGTGGQISLLSDTFFEAPGIEARPFLRKKYLLVGSCLCGGRAYAILEKFLRTYAAAVLGQEAEEQYGIMAKLAEKGAGQDAMKVTTTFNGTRVDPTLRGSITNLSEENFTPEGLVYGTLKGMSQELYDHYLCIQSGTGVQAKHLIASGNGYRKNPIFQKITSEMFQAALTLSPYQEEAACGAALSAQ